MKNSIFKIYLFRSFVIISFLFMIACQNSNSLVKKDFEDDKKQLNKEFAKEISKNGNDEISIDDIENDLSKMDNELEEVMQEMENEMENDTTYSNHLNTDSLE